MNHPPIHMLSAFNLRPGESFEDFAKDYTQFVDELHATDLIQHAGPLGQRVSDTPMDTDDDRTHQLFSIMTFRDRAQMDAAYAHIQEKRQSVTGIHKTMFRRTREAVFTCWHDLP